MIIDKILVKIISNIIILFIFDEVCLNDVIKLFFVCIWIILFKLLSEFWSWFMFNLLKFGSFI